MVRIYYFDIEYIIYGNPQINIPPYELEYKEYIVIHTYANHPLWRYTRNIGRCYFKTLW